MSEWYDAAAQEKLANLKVFVDPNHVGPPLLIDLKAFKESLFEAMKPGISQQQNEVMEAVKRLAANRQPVEIPDEINWDLGGAFPPQGLRKFITGKIQVTNAHTDEWPAAWFCKFTKRQRIEAADYTPLGPAFHPISSELEADSCLAHRATINAERKAQARKLLMASLREWPRCELANKEVVLHWNKKGEAFFDCPTCNK